MTANFDGRCTCGTWCVRVSVPSTTTLSPRICDCDYCTAHPSSIVSDPAMVASFAGSGYRKAHNGDRLASFFYCAACADLLAVGCEFDAVMRGAVSRSLFGDLSVFSEPTQIQPYLLTARQKQERWSKLWGRLYGF